MKFKKLRIMKTNQLSLRWLIILMLSFSILGVKAQPYSESGNQTVCISGVADPYGIINTIGSTYVWTIDGATTSADWILTSTGTNLATVLWKNKGNYTVQVLETNAAGCTNLLPVEVMVTVNPLPTAIIAGTTAICQNDLAPDVTFTGANGTAPYTFTYKINGGADLTVTTISGNSVTVAASTTVAGAFTYTLVSVKDASANACSQTQSGSAVITVNPLPTATIAGTTAECKNQPSVDVTFTGANGTAPYTFTYKINSGSDLTVTTISGNSVTVAAPTTVTGTFTYNLVSVEDASATTCSQTQTGSAVVTINTLPTTSLIYHN
jgi:hypothetical protein